MKTLFERMSEAQREPSTDREKIEAAQKVYDTMEGRVGMLEAEMIVDIVVEALSQGWRSEDGLRKALAEIHDLTQRKQLPITHQINEIADAALYAQPSSGGPHATR